MRSITFVALVFALVGSGCPSPVCDSTLAETRCHGERAEVCASDGQWQLVADCSSVEGAMCSAVEDDGHALHACVPTSGGESE